MNELYELKEKLMDELKEYGSKEMSAGSLEVVDKLTHTIKNLCKIIEDMDEEGYSEYYPMENRGGSYRGGSYREGGGGSYARGRGRNAKRDSMGRYSNEGGYSRTDDDFKSRLYSLMEEAPDEKTRSEIRRVIGKME